MSSQRQIDANRANGAKSRGPVSAAGKAISSKNAIRHGLFAKTILLDNESRYHFNLLVENLCQDLKPGTEIELGIIYTLAAAKWRQMRVWALEASTVNRKMSLQADTTIGDSTARAAAAYAQLADESNLLEFMSSQEARFDRQFHRALDRLTRIREKSFS